MKKKIHHILLVEDEKPHAELACEALNSTDKKFLITIAESLKEARTVLAASDVELAIVDWSLPDGKGSELLPGSLDAATFPIIMMTAHGDEGLAVEAIKAGALDYIVKSPETLSDMRHIAESSLREWEHIVERRRAEKALSENEAKYRAIFEQAIESIWIIDLSTGDIVDFNDKAHETLGYTREEFAALAISDIDAVETSEQVTQHIEKIARNRGDSFETQHKTKEGRIRDVAVSTRVLNLQGGEFALSVLRDITKSKQAEEKLRESEERYRELVDQLPDVVWRINFEGTVTFISQSVKALSGYEPSDFIGLAFEKMLEKFVLEESVEEARKFLERRLRGELGDETIGFEIVFRHKNGKLFTGEIHSGSILSSNGVLAGVQGTIRDITERKRAEEERKQLEKQMRQSQKLESLGVLAGGIAHDFNNLLYVILGNSELVLDTMPAEAPECDHLKEIRIAALRASELTDQMLAYSGKASFSLEKMDLSGLVQEMARLLEVSHTKKAVLKYRFEENLPPIEGDASQLRQVVMNLITNASEAIGKDRGTITVETGFTEATQEYLATTYANDDLPGGPYVWLEVTDDGSGMDEEAKRRIFEPFFTTKFTGRGLGMAAVLGIIRAHGGAIDIQSKVDRGTTVKVLLPALSEPLESPIEQAPEEETWSAQGTVLVVDDDASIRNLLKLLMMSKGLTVLTAENGRQAITLFREHKDEIVCVLLDLTMPQMGGEETFVELHQIRKDMPVVLISGYGETQLKERVGDLGFAGFLKKPVDNRKLLEKVRTMLDL